MGMVINRASFERLIEEDIEWLDGLGAESSLERKHIVDCLRLMPKLLYEYYYKKA